MEPWSRPGTDSKLAATPRAVAASAQRWPNSGGLLDDIDRWVIGRTIALLAERRKAGKNTTLFVKVTQAPEQTTESP